MSIWVFKKISQRIEPGLRIKIFTFIDVLAYYVYNLSIWGYILDKRIKKTKAAIKLALLKTVAQKDLSKVSISDIADAAQINRTTFYLHYKDVMSVWLEIESEIADSICGTLQGIDVHDVYGGTYKVFSEITSVINDLSEEQKKIFYSPNSDYIINRIKSALIEGTYRAFLRAFPNRTNDQYKYLVEFICAGAVDTYVDWAFNAKDSVKLETICHLISLSAEKLINIEL